MAYIIQYMEEVSDTEKVLGAIKRYQDLAYKVQVFSPKENCCGIKPDGVQIDFCDNAMEQAVNAAHNLHAEKCQFYMQKGAVYSVDPYLYPDAEKIKELDYDEAMELSVNGYKEIPPEIIDIAKRNSTRLEILSLGDNEGTVIKEVAGVGEKVIKSMTKDTDIAIVTLTEIPDKKGTTYHIFKALSDENLYVDSIMLPAANQHQQDISFAIKAADKQKVLEIMQEKQQELDFRDIIINSNVAKISVMGAAFQTQSGIASKLLEVLYKSDINIMMIFTSEVKISVVVEKSHADWAIHEIHKNLIR